MTVREEKWAYCPAGAVDEHEWREIEPTPLEGLTHRMRSEVTKT
jgi:hypothetical protein